MTCSKAMHEPISNERHHAAKFTGNNRWAEAELKKLQVETKPSD
jgi:hypothetical protein